jgi:hypothetical protein
MKTTNNIKVKRNIVFITEVYYPVFVQCKSTEKYTKSKTATTIYSLYSLSAVYIYIYIYIAF